MFDPAFSEATDEFIEIYNLSSQDSIDLNGWKISDGSGNDRIVSAGYGLILLPNQYGILLDADYMDSSQTYDRLIPIYSLKITLDGSTFGYRGLSNSMNETVVLYNEDDEIMDQYTYSTGNVPGYSDEKIVSEISGLSGNWADACYFHGTPGYQNSVYMNPNQSQPKVTIFPNPFSPDGDGFEDETEITYTLPFVLSHLNIRIFDMRGRCIRILKGAERSGSQGKVIWDGLLDNGKSASIGIYVIYLEALNSQEGDLITLKTSLVVAGRL
jgi:hypothetical protein